MMLESRRLTMAGREMYFEIFLLSVLGTGTMSSHKPRRRRRRAVINYRGSINGLG